MNLHETPNHAPPTPPRLRLILTACPICDGDLQSTETRTIFNRNLEIEVIDDTYDILDSTWWNDGDTDSELVYCENDHTFQEMLDELPHATPR